MKRVKIQWFRWVNAVLVALLGVLGFSSCEKRLLMYGPPPTPIEEDSTQMVICKYGVPPKMIIEQE